MTKQEVIVLKKVVTKKGFRPADVVITISDGRAIANCPHNPIIIRNIYTAEKKAGAEVGYIDNDDRSKVGVIQYYKGKTKEEIAEIIKWEGVRNGQDS